MTFLQNSSFRFASSLLACIACLLFPKSSSAAPSDSVVVFNEIMYHPAATNPAGEWIEIYNQMAVDVDMSGWRLSGGIDYAFPEGTVLGGGEFLVVSSAQFTGTLDNGGETINLRNNSDRLMDSVSYNDKWPWPPAADGSGASLAKVSSLKATGDVRNWRASLANGGTQGTAEVFSATPGLQLSEIGAAGSASFFVEIFNAGTSPAQLLGVEIVSSSGNAQHTLSGGTLAAGAYLSLDSGTLGFTPTAGQRLFLKSPGGTQILDAVIVGKLQGRRTGATAQDPFFSPDIATSGQANSFVFEDAIVINEIMYHARPNFPIPGTPPTYVDQTALPFNTTWKYQQSGAYPGLDWMKSSFNDNAWPSGQGVLGVESASLSEPIRTGLSLGVITYYFRTIFNYSGNPGTDTLRLQMLIDDGAIFYLNGVEWTRIGMPTGLVDQNTLATSGIGDATIQSIDFPTNDLVLGQNLIAVEVHQVSSGSTDVVFGMEIISRAQTDPGIPDTPFTESREEWIEIFNRSSSAVDLSGWQFSENIDFTFPLGTTLPAGEYMVIADDSAAFAAAHPGVSISGEYSGTLRNGSDRIVLLDANMNPADEVTYHDGGRWDGGADGHGPSLELISPSADNSRGEAWRPSDEGAKSTWKTYSYRAIADSPVPGDPMVWQEFVFGMLHGEGEILIDDISVVQDPDGAAAERIQNGSFSGGSSGHWRMLGNHQRSFVENDALHLVASGATEYQGNQLETTFANGASISNGAEYEISFRARWLSGSSHLNTRLYFNRACKTTAIDVPGSNGTPGAQNSRFVANSGPMFQGLSHSPLLPSVNQPVIVSVTPGDSDGIASVTLHYRPNGGGWSMVNMTVGTGGIYSGTIPGQSAGSIMQFYVTAMDTLGATASFPKNGPNSRALFEVNDGVTANGAVHDLRTIMLTTDSNYLHYSFNSLSNELLGATVIYQNEAFYDVGVRLKGSFVGRDAARVGFNIKFNPDQLFRGVHEKIAIDRSTHADLGSDEIIIKHIATRAGNIPGMYDDIVQFIAPRSEHNRRALIRMAGFDNTYLDSQFENGSDGTLFEYEVYRWATTTGDGTPEGLKRAGGLDSPNGYSNIAVQGFGDAKEDYRWHCLITSNRQRDDYSVIIPFLKTMGLSSTALEAAAPGVMDVDSVLRTLAYQSLVGPADCTYTGGADHNFRLYARPDGRVMYMPWDWDSSFQRATNASLVGGGNWARLINRPANLRAYYGHLKDIIDTAFNSTYMGAWTSHYGSLSGQNFSNRLNYISSRASYVLGQLPAQVPFIITTNGGNGYSVFSSSTILVGNGWIDVGEIRASANGAPLEITWTDADSWTLTLPLTTGANAIALLAYDRAGNQVGSDTITITNLSATEAASGVNLAISEFMYNPASGGTEFIELMNIGEIRIDLTGVRFQKGIDYRFAPNTTLAPGARLVIYESEFLNATKLSNSGERMHLLAGDGSTIRDFTYSDVLPWSEAADDGYSLVLKNPMSNPDHSIPANWRSSTLPGGNPNASDATIFAGSGIDDLIDYAVGEHPSLSISGNTLTISYAQNLAADDVSIRLQWSSDLSTWNDAGTNFELVSITPDGNGDQIVEMTNSSSFAAGEIVFVRLLVHATLP